MIAAAVGDTCLQRSLDPAVFARAYGLVVPAYVAAIAAGALLAPVSVSVIGAGGTLVLVGLAAVAYGAFLLAPVERRGQAPSERGGHPGPAPGPSGALTVRVPEVKCSSP